MDGSASTEIENQLLVSAGFTVKAKFANAQDFTRWFVLQPRGDVSPWAILVTSLREAKPCAMAILAALTGDVSQLRPDARRSILAGVSGTCDGGANQVAIKSMYIRLEKKSILSSDPQDQRLPKWARTEEMSVLDIRVLGKWEKLCIDKHAVLQQEPERKPEHPLQLSL